MNLVGDKLRPDLDKFQFKNSGYISPPTDHDFSEYDTDTAEIYHKINASKNAKKVKNRTFKKYDSLESVKSDHDFMSSCDDSDFSDKDDNCQPQNKNQVQVAHSTSQFFFGPNFDLNSVNFDDVDEIESFFASSKKRSTSNNRSKTNKPFNPTKGRIKLDLMHERPKVKSSNVSKDDPLQNKLELASSPTLSPLFDSVVDSLGIQRQEMNKKESYRSLTIALTPTDSDHDISINEWCLNQHFDDLPFTISPSGRKPSYQSPTCLYAASGNVTSEDEYSCGIDVHNPKIRIGKQKEINKDNKKIEQLRLEMNKMILVMEQNQTKIFGTTNKSKFTSDKSTYVPPSIRYFFESI